MKNKKIIAIILSTIISHNLLNSISVIATENVEEKAYLELKNNNEFIEEDENLTEKDKENDKLFEESKNPIEKDEENDKLPEEGETLISNEKDSNILGNKDNSKNDIKIGNEEKILETITNLERPFENTNSTGEIYLKGFVLSDEKVNRIEVLVNNKKIGNASINLKRDDIFNKYPEYNNRNSGYEYQVKELVNGSNIIATRVYLEDGTYYTRSTIVNVNREQKTNINGTANLMRDKMIQILLNNNKEKTYEYAKNFVDITIKESNAENIRYDVAFAQMMHETNFLKFGGDVKEEQNNFAGLGATGGGVQGHSFESVEIGIRAVIQHLKAYSSTEKLKNECVDPRFNYVKRGSATIVEHLGINENPYGVGWAADRDYGYKLIRLIERINGTSVENKLSTFLDYKLVGDLKVGNTLRFEASSDSEALYKFWVKNYSEDKFQVIKEYGKENTADWKPTKAGKYRVEMWVKNRESKTENYDQMVWFDVDVKAEDKSEFTGYRYNGKPILGNTIELDADSDSEALYKFWVKSYSEDKFQMIKDYGKEDKVNWRPTKAGKYRVEMWVKHKNSTTNNYDQMVWFDVDVKTESKSKFTGYRYNGKPILGNTIELDADSDSEALYKFWVKSYSEDKFQMIKDYGKEDKVNWRPTKAGKYRVEMWVKDKDSTTNNYDQMVWFDVDVKTESKSKFTGYRYNGKPILGNTIELDADSDSEALYKFWVKNYSEDKFQMIKDYGKEDKVNWRPTKAGKYRVEMWVKDKDSTTNNYDQMVWFDVDVKTESKSKFTGYRYNGKPILGNTIELDADSDSEALYKFWVKNYSEDKFQMIKDYGKEDKVNWRPTKAGKYRVEMWVKDKDSTTNNYDQMVWFDVDVKTESKSKFTGYRYNGKPILGNTIELDADSDSEALYKFWVKSYSEDKFQMIKDYGKEDKVNWRPTKAGKYRVEMWVKDKDSTTNNYDQMVWFDVDVKTESKSKFTGYRYNGKPILGNTIELDADSDSEALYKFWVKNYSEDKFQMIKDYGKEDKVNWRPTKAGKYRVEMWVKDKDSTTNNYDQMVWFDVDVKTESKSKFTGYRYNGKPILGNTIELDADSDSEALYKFWVKNYSEDKFQMIKDYGKEDKVNWRPTKAGKYRVEMWVKDKDSTTNNYDQMVWFDVDVKTESKSKFTGYRYKGDPKLGNTIELDADSDSEALYKFWVKNYSEDKFQMIKDYGKEDKVNWKPTKEGKYRVEMWVKDKNSTTNNYDQMVWFDINIVNLKIIDKKLEFDFGKEGPAKNNPQMLVLHHAEAKNSTVESIHNFHKNGNGWAGIGYHYYIRKDGSIYKGREETWKGAHAPAVNDRSLGICVEGAYMYETMPKAQKDAVIKLGKYLTSKYNFKDIKRHRDVTSTDCPGKFYPFDEIKNAILK